MPLHDEVEFVQFCIQYSSLALIYYDYFLTLEREIRYVWNRPFHILTLMYFCCRYSLLSNIVYSLGLINKLENVRFVNCDTAYLISACIGLAGRIGILTIIGVRTCAVYQYHRGVIALFGVLGLFVVISAIVHIPHVSCSGGKVANDPGKRMELTSTSDLLSVSTVVFELFSTVFVATRCVQNMVSIGPIKSQKNSLIFLMLKEGLLYTGFVSLFTTAAMILNYSAPLGSFFQRLLNALTMPISGMMTARFLLHIREWQGGAADPIRHPITVSLGPVQFAAPNPSTSTMETDYCDGPGHANGHKHGHGPRNGARADEGTVDVVDMTYSRDSRGSGSGGVKDPDVYDPYDGGRPDTNFATLPTAFGRWRSGTPEASTSKMV